MPPPSPTWQGIRIGDSSLWDTWADEVTKFNVLGRPQLVWADMELEGGFILAGIWSTGDHGHRMFWMDPHAGCVDASPTIPAVRPDLQLRA